jgi:hypothetical protein
MYDKQGKLLITFEGSRKIDDLVNAFKWRKMPRYSLPIDSFENVTKVSAHFFWVVYSSPVQLGV